MVVAAYIEQLMLQRSVPTVKLHLAAIRTLFDYLVTLAPFLVQPKPHPTSLRIVIPHVHPNDSRHSGKAIHH